MSADVAVVINVNANTLPPGAHVSAVSFVNTTDHLGDATRNAILAVGSPVLKYQWPLDANPGWSVEDQWAWGNPTGGGGAHGGPDPTSGHTGSCVYGYNLNGDYPDNLPERHLTSLPIDCGGLFNTRLKFWRWLGVEQPLYDHAYVRVSNDNVNWEDVWTNETEIADVAWVSQNLDISEVADNQPTVYVRWTMGTTDAGWTYCGWNIDDIEIWAVEVVGTVPRAPEDVEASVVGTSDLRITWSPVTQDLLGLPISVDHYEVYRHSIAYYPVQGLTPIGVPTTTEFTDFGIVGDPAVNHYYRIVAVSSTGLASGPSETVGEFDFDTPTAR
jgi:hypothetical protein